MFDFEDRAEQRNETNALDFVLHAGAELESRAMSSTNEQSLEELRARAELSRAALAANVAELRGRITRVASPSAIKSEARAYVRQERDDLMDGLRARAAGNPLQTAALVAAFAYPALALARAIPVPLLLVGAGLFLTTQRGRNSSATVKAKMDEAVRHGTEAAAEMAESVTSGVSEKVSALRTQMTSAMEAGAKAIPDAAKIGEGTQAAKAQLTELASDTVQTMTARASRARVSVSQFAADNALLLAGVGVIAGALLASSFPVSDAENRVLGPSKRKVKDAVRATAVKGMERGGEVIADALESVTSAASREGFDGSGLQQAVSGLADKARAVAERSVDAALGQEQQQQTFSERNPT